MQKVKLELTFRTRDRLDLKPFNRSRDPVSFNQAWATPMESGGVVICSTVVKIYFLINFYTNFLFKFMRLSLFPFLIFCYKKIFSYLNEKLYVSVVVINYLDWFTKKLKLRTSVSSKSTYR